MSEQSSSMTDWVRETLDRGARDFVERFLGESQFEQISDWEGKRLQNAVASGLLEIDGSLFRTPAGGKYSMFSINREYFTQLAAYEFAAEIYPQGDVRIEYKLLDVAVLQEGRVRAGIEAKSSRREGEKLIQGMLGQQKFDDRDLLKSRNDPLRKIQWIIENRPEDFWVVTPTDQWKFKVAVVGEDVELVELG